MAENRKISIRFFDDREACAVWDNARAKWFSSVVDIVGVLTESKNAGRYWSVLKTRMKKEDVQLTTKCSRLKLLPSDGKRYLTDCFPAENILELVDYVPTKKAKASIEWFTYSDETIDGKRG